MDFLWIASGYRPRNDEVEGDSTFGKSKTKQKLLQGFALRADLFCLDSCDSFQVRDLLLIHESLKWILRYAQYDEIL